MELLFEFLKDSDLVNKRGVNIPVLNTLSKREIYKIVELLIHLTETQHLSKSENAFTHSASQSLTGRSNCSFLPHRLQQLDELARFAAMYSDCVYVENLFLDYEHFNPIPVSELRETLHDDLWILIVMKSLLEAERIKFYTPDMHSCLDCFETVFGEDTRRKIEKGFQRLPLNLRRCSKPWASPRLLLI